MTPRRLVKVNLDELVIEMTAGDPFDGQRVYLDTETGVVVYVPPEDADSFTPSERHAPILRREVRDQYQVMTRFAATETDPEMAALLRFALHGKGAFRRFREAIRTNRDVERRWRAYEADEARARAVEWLHRIGIEPIDVAPRRNPPQVPAPFAVTLVDLLLFGAPDGNDEVERQSGAVSRVFVAERVDEARRAFGGLAREIAQLTDVPWRRSMIEGKDRFELDRFDLRIDDLRIELTIRLTGDRSATDA